MDYIKAYVVSRQEAKNAVYRAGYRQGLLSIAPNLGMFDRELAMQGYCDGVQARKEVLLDETRPLMRNEDMIERLLKKV